MKNLYLKITTLLQELLTNSAKGQIADGIILDPRSFNKVRVQSLSVIIGALLDCALANKPPSRIDFSHINNLLGYKSAFSNDYASISFSNRRVLETHLLELLKTENLLSITEISDLYQQLIALDFYVKGQSVVSSEANMMRNKQGCYYTPKDLVNNFVRRVIDSYLSTRLKLHGFSSNYSSLSRQQCEDVKELLTKSSIVDFSCGTGLFFEGYEYYLKAYLLPALTMSSNEFNKIISSIRRNYYGFDVDYIAVEISRIRLCYKALSSPKKISENIIIANPLLSNPVITNYQDRVEAFQSGECYDMALGIPESLRQKKYDLVLGNPPWEKIRLEERQYFHSYAPGIAALTKQNDRKKAIQQLVKLAPKLHKHYLRHADILNSAKKQIVSAPYYKESAVGELNTYALFSEHALNASANEGVVGLIVKSGLVTTPANKKIFYSFIKNGALLEVADFINLNSIFPIDNRERFACIILGFHKKNELRFACNLEEPKDLANPDKFIRFPYACLKMLNPLTGMLPNVQSAKMLRQLLFIHKNNYSFPELFPDAKFGRLVHFTNHAKDISKTKKPGYLPIYEGKFIGKYDGKFATFKGISISERYSGKAYARLMTDDEKNAAQQIPEARFFIKEDKWLRLTQNYSLPYSLMWRSLTSASNNEPCIATILPHQPASQSVQFLQLPSNEKLLLALALMNSTTFERILRIKLTGIDLTQAVIRQMPVPTESALNRLVFFRDQQLSLKAHIVKRAAILLSRDHRLRNLVKPYTANEGAYNLQEMARIKSEIDALVGMAYASTNAAVKKDTDCIEELQLAI